MLSNTHQIILLQLDILRKECMSSTICDAQKNKLSSLNVVIVGMSRDSILTKVLLALAFNVNKGRALFSVQLESWQNILCVLNILNRFICATPIE